jgi:ribosomal protein S18 acetylase RimI-like enzyme
VTQRQTSSHPLDHVIWASLTTQHRSFAQGDDRARRYPAAAAPFAAVADNSAANFDALAQLLAPGEQVILFTVDEVTPAGKLEVVKTMDIDQMIGPAIGDTETGTDATAQIGQLGADDIDDMTALIRLTNPGPFGTRTIELGKFLGVRVDGRLAAITGERMHLDGFTEITAVCAHPDYRGRGYPRDLIRAVSRDIVDRGETPFLHVYSGNAPAIALYTKLGFKLRRTLRLTILRSIG